jgi:hypothetical protein
MKIVDPAYMTNGWYIGAFSPTAYYTKDFEVAILEHKMNEEWPAHYHALCDEINYLLKGTMMLNDKMLVAPVIFIVEKNEIANPIFYTDCTVVVVKTPSIPGDKYIVPKETL